MKQKITKINYFILILTYIIELILINIQIGNSFSISIYNNMYKWININTIYIALDIVFVLIMLDFACNKNKPKNLLKIYKIDVNTKMVCSFIFLEIIKTILLILLVRNFVIHSYQYYITISTMILSIVIYYFLYAIMPKRDNLVIKLKRFKRAIKKGRTLLNFILIDGQGIPSSFDLKDENETIIGKNNIYINIKNELPQIISQNKKYEKNIRKIIQENLIAIIHVIGKVNNQNISEAVKIEQNNNPHLYHIIASNDLDYKDDFDDFEDFDTIQICKIDSAIEFTENLFKMSEDGKIEKIKYLEAMIKRDIMYNNSELNKNDEWKLTKKEKEYMEIIYQHNYNNRLQYNPENVPKEKFIFELYRNAYLNPSPYESILIFFSYITAIGKLVEFYLFAKNNPKFGKNKRYSSMIGDNPPIWNNHILLNIYKQKDDKLYHNIREREYELSPEERILIKGYLSEILNVKIVGEKITYDGLMELFINFRNKVEAHGIISDENVYAVWNLTRFFVNMLNKIFEISKLECEYQLDKPQVKAGYIWDKKKVDLGEYVKIIDGEMCFALDDKDYINYYKGKEKE